ncbi:MAG: hypothetical protein KBE04_15490 [Phycisphaerae bacterium]|nr:hypothetical protein [Phycisphaerae bacterium]
MSSSGGGPRRPSRTENLAVNTAERAVFLAAVSPVILGVDFTAMEVVRHRRGGTCPG